MLPSKTFTVSCVGGPERVTLKLQDLNDKEGVKDRRQAVVECDVDVTAFSWFGRTRLNWWTWILPLVALQFHTC